MSCSYYTFRQGDYYCAKKSVPGKDAWLAEAKAYEAEVLSKR